MDWNALSDADARALAEAIARVARDPAASMPAPRGEPFYGLDTAIGDLRVLTPFAQQGIFRKYQRAVAVGGGLGGTARWWAAHFGCSVVSVVGGVGLVGGARRLADVAGTTEQTRFETGAAPALPLRGAQFTNAWSAGEDAASTPVIAELFRVLRPGGFAAVRLAGAEPGDAETEQWTVRLRAAGFYAVHVQALPIAEPPSSLHFAERRLRDALAHDLAAPIAARLLPFADAMSAARRDPRPAALVFAERPA